MGHSENGNGCTGTQTNYLQCQFWYDGFAAGSCRLLKTKNNLTYHPQDEIVITVGGSEAIDLAIRSVVNPGDEVLLVEPCFVCYRPIVELMHGVAVAIPTKEENHFKLTAQELREHITEKNQNADPSVSE